MKDRNIFKALEGFEGLITDILLWLVFIPKTLFIIVAYPIWISDHVRKEVDEGGKFEDYISPLLLFLVNSLVLFIIYSTLESGTQRVAGAEKIVAEIQGTRGILAGLGFLSLPLLFALATEIFRGDGLTQKGIKQIFYIQCYYFSPLTLSLFAFILLTELLPDDEFIVPLSFLLAGPIFIWFLIVEIKLIVRELESQTLKIVKAIGVFVLLIVIIFGGIIVVSLLVSSETDNFFEGEPEAITETLPRDDPYTISVRGFENSAGDYRLILIEQPPCMEDNSPNDKPLTYGECVVGSIAGDAAAEWTFEGGEGDNIAILVQSDPELDIGVGLYDEMGQTIQFKDSSFAGGPEAIIQTLPSDDELYIEVEGYDNTAGNYKLTLIELQQSCVEANSIKGRLLKYGNCVMDQVAEDSSSAWAFEGSADDDFTVLVEPIAEFDAMIDVLDKNQRSIQGEAQAFNFIVNFIGIFYLGAIGVAVILGFRSIFRKADKAVAQNEETITQPEDEPAEDQSTPPNPG